MLDNIYTRIRTYIPDLRYWCGQIGVVDVSLCIGGEQTHLRSDSSGGNMQARMLPPSGVFKDLPILGHVLYDVDCAADDSVMLNVYEFKYFQFEDGRVVPKVAPAAETSFLFEHRHMRMASTLYDKESYWLSGLECMDGALCCWLNFPRQTAKRKRYDTDLRVAQRTAACNMRDLGRPLEVNLLAGETKLYQVVDAFFPSDSPLQPKTGFAILVAVGVVPRANLPRSV